MSGDDRTPGRWVVVLHGRSVIAAYLLIAAIGAGSVYDGVTGTGLLFVPSAAAFAALVVILAVARWGRQR